MKRSDLDVLKFLFKQAAIPTTGLWLFFFIALRKSHQQNIPENFLSDSFLLLEGIRLGKKGSSFPQLFLAYMRSFSSKDAVANLTDCISTGNDFQPGFFVNLTINGQQREVKSSKTITELVRELNIVAPNIAVAVNQQVIPRSQYDATPLVDGDTIEIVHAVGGGT